MDGAGVCVAWMILESRNYNYTSDTLKCRGFLAPLERARAIYDHVIMPHSSTVQTVSSA